MFEVMAGTRVDRPEAVSPWRGRYLIPEIPFSLKVVDKINHRREHGKTISIWLLQREPKP
jgi:hypothetical protein